MEKGELPYDVPVHWIPIGLAYAALGGLVNGTANLVMSLIKVLPLMQKLYGHVFKTYFECPFEAQFWLFVPFLLSLVAIPVVSAASALVFPLAGIILGMAAAGAAYNRGFKAGFHRIAHTIYDCDKFSNMIVFDRKMGSWVPCLKLGEPLSK